MAARGGGGLGGSSTRAGTTRDLGGAFAFALSYSDSVVHQREPLQASIWGFAPDVATPVQVTVAVVNATGQTTARATTVVRSGRWRVSLPPQPATPAKQTLAIVARYNGTAGAGRVAIHDVLFGEVWPVPVVLVVRAMAEDPQGGPLSASRARCLSPPLSPLISRRCSCKTGVWGWYGHVRCRLCAGQSNMGFSVGTPMHDQAAEACPAATRRPTA